MDELSTDTLTPAPHHLWLHLTHETDAPSSQAESARFSTHAPAWHSGIESQPSPHPAVGSLLMLLLVGCTVLLAFNHRTCRRFATSFLQSLLITRRRSNSFDDTTAGESRIMLMMMGLTCLLEGIVLYIAAGRSHDTQLTLHGSTQLALAAAIGVTTAYYFFQTVAYNTVGYVFASTEDRRLFVRAFHSSQTLLGVTLLIPTMVMLFYPATTFAMIAIAAVLYFTARITFIWVGFRIFYNNFASLLYFILYLCTLEIVPLLQIYRIAVSI